MGRPALWISVSCENCGDSFDAKPYKIRAGRRFCSITCRIESTRSVPKPFMRGNQFAVTENPGEAAKMWRTHQQFGEPGMCEKCQDTADLWHHVDGNRANLELCNVQALCRACHMDIHRPALVEGRVVDDKHPGKGYISKEAFFVLRSLYDLQKEIGK